MNILLRLALKQNFLNEMRHFISICKRQAEKLGQTNAELSVPLSVVQFCFELREQRGESNGKRFSIDGLQTVLTINFSTRMHGNGVAIK